jgi:hypothetical protein
MFHTPVHKTRHNTKRDTPITVTGNGSYQYDDGYVCAPLELDVPYRLPHVYNNRAIVSSYSMARENFWDEMVLAVAYCLDAPERIPQGSMASSEWTRGPFEPFCYRGM